MKRGLALLVVVLLLVVTGCGSNPASTGVDPASLAPQGTLAYATLNLAPEGAEKADFDAAFGKLLGGAPQQKFGEAFTHAASTSGKLAYETDVKPWLGDSLSLVVTKVAREKGDFAVL